MIVFIFLRSLVFAIMAQTKTSGARRHRREDASILETKLDG